MVCLLVVQAEVGFQLVEVEQVSLNPEAGHVARMHP